MNPEHRGNESKTSNRQTKASLPARKTCLFLSTNDNVVWGWLVPFEGSLELQEPLWQQCTTPKEAWLQALQETLHHVRPTRSC